MEGCASETNPESKSMSATVLTVLLAGLGPERTRKVSGRRVKGIFAPACVELETAGLLRRRRSVSSRSDALICSQHFHAVHGVRFP